MRKFKIAILVIFLFSSCLTACTAQSNSGYTGAPNGAAAPQTSPPTGADTSANANAQPFIPANADVVYDGGDYVITKRKLYTYHIARDDYGDISLPSAGYSYYSDGLLLIGTTKSPRKYGYTDKNANIAIPCQYESALPFSEGLAAVKTYDEWTGGYGWGFIDTFGKMIVPAKYDEVHSFSEGLAAVRKNKEWAYIDTEGKEVIPFGKYLGEWQAGYGNKAHDFKDGLSYTAYLGDDSTYRLCYIDKTGDLVIDMKPLAEKGYSKGWDFSDGLARVGSVEYGGCGFIDKSGSVVIELPDLTRDVFSRLGDFRDGYAVIWHSGKGTVIDKSGNTVFSLDGRNMEFVADEFSEGLISVRSTDSKKMGFMDTSGNVVVPFVLNRNLGQFHSGFAGVEGVGYVDGKGNIISLFTPSPQGGAYYGDFNGDCSISFLTEGTTTAYLLQVIKK